MLITHRRFAMDPRKPDPKVTDPHQQTVARDDQAGAPEYETSPDAPFNQKTERQLGDRDRCDTEKQCRPETDKARTPDTAGQKKLNS
jgi:hypothetical protein